MSDRIDDLLDRALVTGVIPEGVTAEERAELEGLLAAMQGVKETGLAIRAEAQATMPTARARFERFTAGQQQRARPALAASGRHPGWCSRFLGGRGLSFAGVAAAAAAIVVGALILPGSFGGVESASAQVLTEGSYVQVEGVVTNQAMADGRVSLVVQSDLGEIAVDLADGTSVLDDEGAIGPGDVHAGRQVVVSGVVGKAHRVQAQTVTLGREAPPPVPLRVEQLKDLPQRMEGEVRTISLSPDGKRARIHIVTATGGHFWAVVEAPGVQALLERSANVLGTAVRIVHPPGAPRGVFLVEPVGEADPGSPTPPVPTAAAGSAEQPGRPGPSPAPQGDGSAEDKPARPALVTIRGVVLSRDGALVMVQADTRVVTVRVTRRTVILVGPDGVSLDALSGERAVGHEVAVTGVLNEQMQELVADVIVLGPKPETRD